jgi:hypothetical protein
VEAHYHRETNLNKSAGKGNKINGVAEMTAQRTIARLRKEKIELLEANKNLLDNNVILSEENQRLKNIMKSDQETIEHLAKEKKACKQKCDLVIREKDAIILEKERRLQNIKDAHQYLDEMKWTRTVKAGFNGDLIVSFVGVHSQ